MSTDVLSSRGLEALARLATAVDELAAVDPADLTERDLARHLVALRAQLDRQEAVFARFAGAGDARALGAAEGAASTAAWLRQRTGMREGEAKAAIAAGSACTVLPQLGAAWRAGEVSTAAARTVAEARLEGHDDLFADCEPTFVKRARSGDLRALRQACAQYQRMAREQGDGKREPDTVTIAKTYRGRTTVTADLADVAAETVVTALHAFADPPAEGDNRSTGERYAAALVRMAEVALEHAPEGRRARAGVTIVIDWQTLTNGAPGRLDGQFTGPLHPDTIEQLLCDCSVNRVLTGPDSLPLDVGRSQRTVPAGLKRAVIARDGGCRFPGCDRPAGWTQIHHVIPWHRGGPTALWNLVLLCDHHHAVLHRPGWRAEFDGREFRVFQPDGTPVRAGPRPARAQPAP